MTRSYLDWKYAPESGADDEPPTCDVDGCGEEGLNAGGHPGCAAGQRGEP